MKKKQITVRLQPAKNQKKKKRVTASELTRLGSALRTLGGMGGTAAGNLVGMPVAGHSIGYSLGAALSRWLGSGDYSVASNSIVTRTQRGSAAVPSMHKTDQSIIVRHREFISTITSSTGYSAQQVLDLNPGLSRTFPWLSGIAAQYQEYKFRGIVFHYVPTSGMVTGANTALGSVMMQTVYRATDSPPTTKYEMLNEYWSNETMPSEPMAHPIECAPSQTVLTRRYVRNGSVTDDIMFYDYGRTIVATQGQQTDGQIIGDLWVTYEVELSKPKLTQALGDNTRSYFSRSLSFSSVRPWAGHATVPPTVNTFNGTVLIDSPLDNEYRVRIPPGNAGRFLLTSKWGGGSTATFSGTNGFILQNATGLSNPMESPPTQLTITGSGTSRIVLLYAFRITDPTLTTSITFTGINFAFPVGWTCDISLTQLDSEIPSY